MYFADYHVHTTVSDGSDTPEELFQKAAKIGLTHLSLTDHDTTLMAQEHKELAKRYGITGITGVEMSAADPATGKKVHLLGYDYSSGRAIEELGRETLRKRHENGLRQIEILKQRGYQIEPEEVYCNLSNCIYKQHILEYLEESGQSDGLFGSIYQNIFKNGGPCDFDIDYPDVREVLLALKEDGAMAVLAHPGQQDNYYLVKELASMGLDGIEENHPSHGQSEKNKARAYAAEFGLFLTGGSDYHGRYEKTSVRLGEYPSQGTIGWKKFT